MNDQIEEFTAEVNAVRNFMAMGRHDGVLFTETELERYTHLAHRHGSDSC